MTAILRPEPLTAAAFAPFGEVIDSAGHAPLMINEGHTERFHDLAELDLAREGGRPCLSLFRTRPKALPLMLGVMERHPLASQSFFPLSGRPYLVVVAPAGDFDPAGLRAFLAGPGQGVSYHAGTWHHYSLALGATAEFLVIDRAGAGDNCDEIRLDPMVLVDLTP